MFQKRNVSTVLRGPGGWLAAALLATAAVLVYANLVWAQQTSTEAAVPAPSLTAEANNNGTAELNWTAVTGAERYELWVWTSADGWQQIGGDSLTDTTYSHTELTAGTIYYYTVRAVNAAGESGPWSEYASATVTTGQTPMPTQTPTSTAMPLISTTPTPTPSATAAAALSAPVLSAQVTVADTIDLSWGVVADAARYDLFSWWNADTGWQKLDDGNLTDTTYSHTGLTAGTTYYYTVRAVNAAGETGLWSEYASATVTTGQTPMPTQTPTPTAMPLISTTPTPTVVPMISTTPTPTPTVTPAAMPMISTTPTPTAMPMIPTTPTPTAMPMIPTTPTPTPSATVPSLLSAPVLAAQVTVADTIDLSWGVVADAARYELFTWWNADTGWQKLHDGNLTDTTYSHTGLTAGTTYYYTVRAVNAAGETGPWSEYASATVTAGQTPTPTVTATPAATTASTPTPFPAGSSPTIQTHNIILRVVRVTQDWIPYASTGGWPAAATIKKSDALEYLEVAIWEETSSVHLYEFPNDYDSRYGLRCPSGVCPTDEQKIAFREQYLIRKYTDMPAAYTDERSDFLKSTFIDIASYLVNQYPDSGHHLMYSGHGGPGGALFNLQLRHDDANAFLASWSQALTRPLSVIDMGGPCTKGSFADLENFCHYASFFIASDMPNGGYTMDDWTIEKWNEISHEIQYHRLFANSDSLEEALKSRIDLKRRRYEYSRNNMIANQVEQANYLYSCAAFRTFSPEFKSFLSQINKDHELYDDLYTFMTDNRAPAALIEAFKEVFVHKADNRDFFTWSVVANGMLMPLPQ